MILRTLGIPSARKRQLNLAGNRARDNCTVVKSYSPLAVLGAVPERGPRTSGEQGLQELNHAGFASAVLAGQYDHASGRKPLSSEAGTALHIQNVYLVNLAHLNHLPCGPKGTTHLRIPTCNGRCL